MHRFFEAFLEHLRLDQRSALTVRRYRYVLDELERHTGGQEPQALTRDDLSRFAARPCRQDRARAPAGVKLRVAVLRQTFCYLHDEGLIATNPATRLPRIRLPRRTPKYLTPPEIAQLLQHVQARPSRNRCRDLGLVLIFWQTALRVSEVPRLRWRQVDGDRLMLTDALLKGGHVLDVFINIETLTVLRGLRVAAGASDADAIFARYDGQPVGVRAIEALFQTWRVELGWTRRLHPHVLRHAHATGERADGVRLETVAESLHHADVRTAQVYASVQDPELRAALAKLGRHVPREILREFHGLATNGPSAEKSSCVEPSFYAPGEAA